MNVMVSGIKKKLSTAEILANDLGFLQKFYDFIDETNTMRMLNLPENFQTCLQLLMSERQYLINLIKGLIYRILPKEKPQIFNDPFLEKQYEKLKEREVD